MTPLPKAFLAAALLAAQAVAVQAQQSLTAGVALATDYLFDSVSQAHGTPVIQGYLEYEVRGFYVGLWGSRVDMPPDRLEYNIYAGYRGEAGGLSYDIGYWRYLYDATGNCCGEAILNLGAPVSDQVELGLTVGYDFAASDWRSIVTVSYGVTEMMSVSAALGYNGAGAYTHWNAGVSLAMTDTVGLDLRYYDGNGIGATVAAMLTADFTIFSN
jgi:uncharacterized protein (TIGR02001 family)